MFTKLNYTNFYVTLGHPLHGLRSLFAGVQLPCNLEVTGPPCLCGKRKTPWDTWVFWKHPGQTHIQASGFGVPLQQNLGLQWPGADLLKLTVWLQAARMTYEAYPW